MSTAQTLLADIAPDCTATTVQSGRDTVTYIDGEMSEAQWQEFCAANIARSRADAKAREAKRIASNQDFRNSLKSHGVTK